MADAVLVRTLYDEMCRVPLIDPHSHIDPHAAASKSLADILGYHYYTELAHSAGLDRAALAPEVPARERVRAVVGHMDRYANTAQYSWFVEIARTFLGFAGDRVTAADADGLFDAAERAFARPDWEEHVLRTSGLEKVFLTNEFDDPLAGFDTARYVPCLRTDTLVFAFDQPQTRERLARATGVEANDEPSLRRALGVLFAHFVARGAKACAVSLPPGFAPRADAAPPSPERVFWLVAEQCAEHGLPFDLMIGVNRNVYPAGVHQGRDLYDSRCSLVQYAELFNAFPAVTFPVSVLTSYLNQELVSYAWIFPNVVTNGHWWYSNIPVYIENDLRGRLQAVPSVKQVGYYSDMYKLEFGLPKFNMYRRVLAKVLAEDFVEPGRATEAGALDLARALLRGNVERVFGV